MKDIEDREWFKRTIKNAYGLETLDITEYPPEFEEDIRVSRLRREVCKEGFDNFRKEAMEILNNIIEEGMEEDVKIVPTSDNPEPEVEKRAKELEEFLNENPERKNNFNMKLLRGLIDDSDA